MMQKLLHCMCMHIISMQYKMICGMTTPYHMQVNKLDDDPVPHMTFFYLTTRTVLK